MDLAILFVSAFAASTILPMSSEVVLGALAVAGANDFWLLFAVATAGNTLGAVATWALGRYVATWRNWLTSLDEAEFQRASRWFNRWGIWCLLLSWLPVIGDPLTLVAGVLRTAFLPFLLLVLVGKAARYLFVLLIVAGELPNSRSRARIRPGHGATCLSRTQGDWRRHPVHHLTIGRGVGVERDPRRHEALDLLVTGNTTCTRSTPFPAGRRHHACPRTPSSARGKRVEHGP